MNKTVCPLCNAPIKLCLNKDSHKYHYMNDNEYNYYNMSTPRTVRLINRGQEPNETLEELKKIEGVKVIKMYDTKGIQVILPNMYVFENLKNNGYRII